MPSWQKYSVRGKSAYKFRITHPDTKKRSWVRLGVVSKADADEAGNRLDELIEAVKYETDLPPRLVSWLSRLPDQVYERLVTLNLVESRQSTQVPTLEVLLNEYVATKQWKESTRRSRQQTINDLLKYFKPDRAIDRVKVGEAKAFAAWLQKSKPGGRGLAAANARKKIKDSREFFAYARECDYIAKNPFAKISLPPASNPDRLFYVTAEMMDAVFQQIKDPEFRLIVALAYYAGFRTPSEATALCWGDIDWERGQMQIRSPKTAHHANHGIRFCPIFEPLEPYLLAVQSSGGKAEDPVVPMLRTRVNSHLRTQFIRYVEQAGLTPWPRIFQNLRATALTDLADAYPINMVCKWLGNQVQVAMDHYVILRRREYEGPRTGTGGKTS
ncbi:site-specific tyrosine recombinase XerC [Crateriforma conspicua]|uniref:Site-specific tyrosine recombinase XerC n=1 Tax=Crateriforma conspicua TaxID=2527996 RepID=A0A5C6FRH9_9PLAN|nr:site-specific integrase [Crateriforma conspicua]TWU65509.1 site-specific tyrosine recombinase XerC [Crateriforma conspicua]